MVINGEDKHCALLSLSQNQQKNSFDKLGIEVCGQQHKISQLILNDWLSHFTIGDIDFTLNVPGQYNVMNALAAITTCLGLGVSIENCAQGLQLYEGIERRFHFIGNEKGITVIDDYAHNPAKVEACLTAVHSMRTKTGKKKRVVAIFHPHGFGPMKLLQKEFIETFIHSLEDQDLLFMPEIYYAGGSADKSISSNDIIQEINKRKPIGTFFADKNALLKKLPRIVKKDDLIINMGARDPNLGSFARKILYTI